MDIGLIHAKEFILRIYQDPEIVDMNSIMVDDNYKDHLMRHCQVNNWPLQNTVYVLITKVYSILTSTSTICFVREVLQKVKNKLNKMQHKCIFKS